MDARIILAGQGVNALQAMSDGTQAAGLAGQVGQQGDLLSLYRQQGPGIAAGDQNALNALSQIDPMQALGVQESRQGMQIRDEQLQMARAAAARQAEEYARGISAEQREQERRQLEQGLTSVLPSFISAQRTGDTAALTQQLRTLGVYDGQQNITVEEAAIMLAQAESVFETFGRFTEMTQPAQPEVPAAMQTLQLRAQAAGLQPGTPEYQQFMLSGAGGGTTVNVQNTMPGQNRFDEAFASQDAEALSGVSASGLQAQRNIPRIDALEGFLSASSSGFSAVLASRAGEFGINTEGLSDIQTAQAIINSLVPEQRQPGSGPMSDADLALFQQSLPRLINTPEGNRQIIATMRGIAQYDAQGAQIVQRLRSGEITRAQAFDLLQSRENPLASFRASEAQAAGGQQPQGGAQDFGTMGIEDMLNVQIDGMTIEQLRAYNARMDALLERGQ